MDCFICSKNENRIGIKLDLNSILVNSYLCTCLLTHRPNQAGHFVANACHSHSSLNVCVGLNG